MTTKIPRIAAVTVAAPSALAVRFDDGTETQVELAGWIATGGTLLAPLRDPAVFGTARIGLYGGSVAWGEEDGDLAIDAHHLRLLTAE
ncbi:DUF2442 domain-containing protein [Methylorubrum salsuginis]|uniref:DUF2442 domain-containing protein n=1 Tax=Methylorubrum salsuginis TaxID=414703 RepID=A0A1I4L869_9HYPH|nr:DUF2442 domain-containing protein [Methylorubrum salsuginis]SFL87003.1 Protein of unknown function [Methylorubrum salsuginis]